MPHIVTHGCLQKAESLIETGDLDSLRHASLQLRMGIEYLFYELIPSYKDELPDDIMTANWQPQKIFDEILECNPDADKDARYAFGPAATTPGSEGWMAFDSKSPTKRVLKEHYHRLGRYLHAPVNMVNPSLDKWRGDLENAATCLKEYKLGQVLCNVRPLVEIRCKCGRTIKRNKFGVEASGVMRCPDPKCKRIYDVRFVGDSIEYTPRESNYECPYCGAINYVPASWVVNGIKFNCDNCRKGVEFRATFRIEPIDGDPNTIGDAMTDSEISEFFAQTGNTILARINATNKPRAVVKASEALLGRLVQSGNTLRVLSDNAGHEWTWDAASIVRTSYDAMLQALYIFHDNAQCEELAMRFLDFRVIEQVKLLRLFEQGLTSVSRRMVQSPRRAKYEGEILKEFDRVCQKYGIDQSPSKRLPKDWHGSDLRKLAKKTGYESEYLILQKQLSAIVHSSVFGIDTTYFKPEHLIHFQWDFAYRVLDKVAAYAGIELMDSERKLLDLSKQNIFDRLDA
jgi:hypothetical protein